MDYGIKKSIEIKNKRIGYACDDVDTFMKSRLYDFSRMPYLYSADVCGPEVRDLTLGDTVYLTDSRILDPTTGTRGITQHIGYVSSFAWNEVANKGTIQITIPYDTSEFVFLGITAIATWGAGAIDDSFRVSKKEGNYMELDTAHLQINPKWTLEAGNRISVVHINDGIVDMPTIVSARQTSTTTWAIELDRVVSAPTNNYDLYVNPTDFLRQEETETNTKMLSTYIANTSNRLSATQSGYKLVR